MTHPRPWKTDAELEQETQPRGGYGYRAGYVTTGPRSVPSKPWATYGLLITFLAYFILEYVILFTLGPDAVKQIFMIYANERYDWIYRPWSPITSMLSHDPGHIGHILFNSLALYFFGPYLELLLGVRRFLAFFTIAGVLSGIMQAALVPVPALGASGAIMGLIGLTIVLRPHAKIILFPIPAPIPLWVAGIIFALIDLTGAFSGSTGIGNVAHLSGMAVGLLYGYRLRPRLVQMRGS